MNLHWPDTMGWIMIFVISAALWVFWVLHIWKYRDWRRGWQEVDLPVVIIMTTVVLIAIGVSQWIALGIASFTWVIYRVLVILNEGPTNP